MQPIVAVAAFNAVVTGPAVNRVVAVLPVKNIASLTAVDEVVSVRARDSVTAAEAEGNQRPGCGSVGLTGACPEPEHEPFKHDFDRA